MLRTNSRAGVTLVEIFVVLAVLGLLLSLLLPAVQQSRMVAYRMGCTNHLRQIGIATHQYVQSSGSLPGLNLPALFQLFPYLDLQNWSVEDPNLHLGKRHAILLCPLDNLHDATQSPFSYLMSGGSCLGCGEGVVHFGSTAQSGVRWSEIVDGLSTTALFSERRASIQSYFNQTSAEVQAICEADPARCTWRLGRIFGQNEDDAYVQACGDPARRLSADPPHDDRIYWVNGMRPYSHVLPPNMPSCYRGYPFQTSHPLGATSHHQGGVNVLLCDGAVRFVSNSIHLRTWWALGTRNGHEVIEEF